MDINVTLLVQIGNFFIAYALIEKYLLRSVVASINQEQQHYNDLVSTINTQQQLIKNKEERKQHEWNEIKLLFARMIPHITPSEQLVRPQVIKPEIVITKQKKQEYEQELQKIFIKRLSHVS